MILLYDSNNTEIGEYLDLFGKNKLERTEPESRGKVALQIRDSFPLLEAQIEKHSLDVSIAEQLLDKKYDAYPVDYCTSVVLSPDPNRIITLLESEIYFVNTFPEVEEVKKRYFKQLTQYHEQSTIEEVEGLINAFKKNFNWLHDIPDQIKLANIFKELGFEDSHNEIWPGATKGKLDDEKWGVYYDSVYSALKKLSFSPQQNARVAQVEIRHTQNMTWNLKKHLNVSQFTASELLDLIPFLDRYETTPVCLEAYISQDLEAFKNNFKKLYQHFKKRVINVILHLSEDSQYDEANNWLCTEFSSEINSAGDQTLENKLLREIQ